MDTGEFIEEIKVMQMKERIVAELEIDDLLKKQHASRYEFAGEFVSGKTVLDVACGTGYGTAMLGERGAKQVTGVDISNEAIQYAENHYSRTNVQFAQQSVQDLSQWANIDLVVSFETVEHLSEPNVFLGEIVKCMNADGFLIISTPIRHQGTIHDKPRNPFHIREWNEDEFIEMLGQYFVQINIHYQYNFKKRWYPYSRTLSRLATQLFYQKQMTNLQQFQVGTLAPKINSLLIMQEYMIAVCRNPGLNKGG